MYNELYETVPDLRKIMTDAAVRDVNIGNQVKMLSRYVSLNETFLEIGAGDCKLSLAMAAHAGRCIAVEVSSALLPKGDLPTNFSVVMSKGTDIPVDSESVDLVFSDQLMEHLHPQDAAEQLKQIFKCLKPGGRYICVTPNRISGPHDVSGYFDAIATGMHMKEYTYGELKELFCGVGFSKVRVLLARRNVILGSVPVYLFSLLERAVLFPPDLFRNKILDFPLIRLLLGVKIIAIKLPK
ncbi:class I SAM-dependent methyltransferase [Belnapia mucosa]|uniref:class I SAM-dependent methyltransferase n=1 Tax=Belnapia mucosa TaxID=2804532 RepID=UPI00192E11B3|nr:class I SAM-dependent methyltransferase [Belnapia mucosa]